MLSRIDILSQPTTTPVSLSNLKAYVRFYDDSDDALLQNFLCQATELAEQYLGRKLFNYQLKWTTANTKHHNRHGSNDGWMNNGYNWGYWWGYRKTIELPTSPIISLDAVSYGHWGEPDTFLVAGTDYYADLSTEPGRVQLLNPCFNSSWHDHISFVFSTGYAQTSSLSTVGTSTATQNLSLTVGGGQGVSVAVTTGDTAQTVTGNALTAIQASGAILSAEQATPSMLALRGANALVTVNNEVAGLTVTASTPISAIPQSIQQAILTKAANLYRSMGRGDAAGDEGFYRALDPWRFVTIVSG